MDATTTIKPFNNGFIGDLVITQSLLPFTDLELKMYDARLTDFEQVFLNPEIERGLITKNELLTSYGISKAEDSSLTVQEAKDVYALIQGSPNYTFITQKLASGKKLSQKDHDKLEFFNIAKTFGRLNANLPTFNDITVEFILQLHRDLTAGMDIFKEYLPSFTVYKSGTWRDNDNIRVGTYAPAPSTEIKQSVNQLLTYLKANQTVSGVAIFHTALYALHPFNNGNKRVCRVLEHLLLRGLGLNQKNLYSTSYYYYKEKDRYYKNLLYSLERKNLNHFVGFIMEALMLSMMSVIKTSLEAKKSDFLTLNAEDANTRSVLKPLVKRKEVQFKNLYKPVDKKMARQTFVDLVQKAVDQNLLTKREAGRSVYYSLAKNFPEEQTIKDWLEFIKSRLPYIPRDFLLSFDAKR